MGWLHDLLRKEPEDTFFGPVQAADGNAAPPPSRSSLPPGTPVEPESAYLHLYLETMRLSAARRGSQTYYGSVISSCAVLGDCGWTELAAVAAPSALRGVDAKHLDRVITATASLISAVPYRGGGLNLEIGLFALPEQDLLGPYLDFLSDVAGVASAFLPLAGAMAAAALLPAVHKGLDQLFGASTKAILDVGLLRKWEPPVTGHYAVVRGLLEPVGGFRVSAAGRLLMPDGTEVQAPYLVLRLDARTERETWREIPEVSAAHQRLKAAIRSGDVQAAKWSLGEFRRIADDSPGLLSNDAQRLYVLMDEYAKDRLQPTGTAAGLEGTPQFPELADIDLYADL
jgi:hypothetical protein